MTRSLTTTPRKKRKGPGKRPGPRGVFAFQARKDGSLVLYIEWPDGHGENWWDGEPIRIEPRRVSEVLAVVVRLPEGRYRLSFYDLARAGQALGDARAEGQDCFTEPGLVLVSEVNTASVQQAVSELAKDLFFKRLRPIDPIENP